MASYFVDKYPDDDGNHLIHAAGCRKIKSTAGKIYLGKYEHCSSAIIAAQKHYPKLMDALLVHRVS